MSTLFQGKDETGVGVRCGDSRLNLWFHLPFSISDDPYLNTRGEEEIHDRNCNGLIWNRLNDQGRAVLHPIWELPLVTRIVLRPTYFDVVIDVTEADAEQVWEALIPQIVATIRTVGGGNLRVYVRKPFNPRVKKWHAPMMKRLSL